MNSRIIDGLIRPDLGEETWSRLRSGVTLDALAQWVTDMGPPRAEVPTSKYLGTGPMASAGFALPTRSSAVAGHPQQRLLQYEPDQPSPGTTHFPAPGRTTHTGSQAENIRWPDTDTSRASAMQPVVSRPGHSQASVAEPGANQVLGPAAGDGGFPASSAWTNITADGGLVKHLLALYFCWEYPTFASLSKEHFLKDFEDGRIRFCSSILVNALLALGCRFSTKPSTRAVPHDPYTSGDHFFREALRLYNEEPDHHKLTTIQALGIMSIREASCGRDSESWYYAGQSIKLAIEMGLHEIQENGMDDDQTAVQAATFWGAFALDQ